jgi:NAD(P)-dependent dehydrogenase (short-subunit alcohol dehydrogenase family)
MEWAGRVVVVTGGASGIGEACAAHAAALGARVAVFDVALSSLQPVPDVAGSLHHFSIDVTNERAVADAFIKVESELGPVSALVTSAGTARAEQAEIPAAELLRSVIDLNLSGTFICCREAGRLMLARNYGAIVTIGSVSGVGGQAGRAHYCASKSAVINLTRALAIEWSRRGVRVNCVSPGIVDTPLIRRALPPEQIERVLLPRTPLGRAATPHDIARAVCFLLGEDAGFITGANLMVDGGLTAGRLNGISDVC